MSALLKYDVCTFACALLLAWPVMAAPPANENQHAEAQLSPRPLSAKELADMPEARPEEDEEPIWSQVYEFAQRSGQSITKGVEDIHITMPQFSDAKTPTPAPLLQSNKAPTPSPAPVKSQDKDESSRPPFFQRASHYLGLDNL